jgi:hypothetical protein
MPYLLSRLPPSGRAAARRARQKRPRLRGADRGRLRRLAATSSDYLALPPLLTWRSGFGAVLYSASKSLDRKPLRLLLATCLLTLLAAAPASAAVAPRGTPTTTTDGTGTATSKSFTTPSAAVAGDLLVSTISYRTRTASDIANVVPSGWAKATEAFDSGGSAGVHVAVIYRTATGGAQTAAWSFASAPAGMVISTEAYSGADTSAPFERIGCGPETGPSSTYNHKAPTFTPTVGGTMGFAAFGARASETWTPSTPLIERTDARAGTTNQATLETADSGATTLAAGTPVTLNSTGSASTSTEVSCGGNLKPAAASPPPDTTPPDSSITAQPANPTTSTDASFSFSSTESGSSFQCSLDGAAYASCTSPKTYSGLGAGNHNFSVKATDAAGNTDSTPARYSWTINPPTDTAPPDTSITAHPSDPTMSTDASFSFASTESGSMFQCSLDSGAYGSCSSPEAYSGLAVGSHTLSVKATDAAGNTDASPATFTWTIQAPPPPSDGWTNILDDQFNTDAQPVGSTLIGHWNLYNGPYSSGGGLSGHNCATPSHDFISGGSLHLLMKYEASDPTGTCGGQPGWFNGGMMVSKTYGGHDQRVTVRFRVANSDPVNVRAHRIIPMRFFDDPAFSWPAGGEEDWCEGSGLTDCTTFFHPPAETGTFHNHSFDLTQWHTFQVQRITNADGSVNVKTSIDGVVDWTYTGSTSNDLPDSFKRVVLQQECRSAGCPSSSFAGQTEDIQIDWLTIDNRS